MAQITRSTKVGGGTTLQSNTLARAADVEADMLTLFTAHNNADTGTTKWQVGSFENAVSVPLIANNGAGTNDIVDFRDSGSSVFKIADVGIITHTGNFANRIQGPDGTAAAPTFGFASSGNDDNGLFLSAGNTLGFSAGGTNRLSISTTAITAALALAMGSNKITGLAAATAAGDALRFEQLKVIQWQVGTSTTQLLTSSGTFVNSNLSASITPTSASNSVLILAFGTLGVANGTETGFVGLARATTDLTGADGQQQHRYTGAGQSYVPCAFGYVDAPATTSATTYRVRVRSGAGGNIAFGVANQTQFIIVIEVAP
jgi:hypothetical protein